MRPLIVLERDMEPHRQAGGKNNRLWAFPFLAALPIQPGSKCLWLALGVSAFVGCGLAWLLWLRKRFRLQTAAIEAEKNLLATLIDNLPENIYVKDLDGRYVLTNRSHARFHGAPSPDWFRGKPASDFFSAAVASSYASADAKILRGETNLLEYEEDVPDGQGRLRRLATTKVPLKDSAGKILGLVGFSRDITEARHAEQRDVSERRRVEAVLAYERDLLTTLFENLPDALYFKDLQSRFVRVSKSKLESSWAMALMRHRFSSSKSESKPEPGSAQEPLPEHLTSLEAFAEFIIGKSDFDFFESTRARGAFDDEQEIIRTGKPLIGKVEQTTHLDGRVTWSLSTKMPWHDRDGQIIGTFGISKDITAMKQAEASVAQVHRQLVEASRHAGMAEVATGVLHNVGNVLNSVNVSTTVLSEKLRHSRLAGLEKVAALLGENSDQLTKFLTNDTRGRSIPAYLDQLARHLQAEQALLLDEISSLARNVEHIKQIVAMQQTYARPAGIAEPVQPAELMEDALRINSGSLAKHNVEVVRDYASPLPTVTVDKHKVLQIIVNLISNAGHACAQSPHQPKRVTLRLSAQADRFQLSVSDNGVGIAPENVSRIFNLGFTTRPDGHGFGLHSGALAAREMGGRLSLQTDGPGHGATFTLDLPVTPQKTTG